MTNVPVIKLPQSPFVDRDGNISREWRQWLLNPQFLSFTLQGVVGVTSGGTGVGDVPGPGQLLIGDGTGYMLGALTPAPNRITITNGPGTISIDISAFYAGQSTISTLGTVTAGTWHANTINPAYGGTGISSYIVGDLICASGATTLSALADVATGNALISGGVGIAPSWGKIGLSTHVSGDLPVTNLNSGTGAGSSTFWRGDGAWSDPLGLSGTPTIAAGAGAGTGPTIAIAGTDHGFRITLTTGTLPTLSATVCTVTFSGTYASTPHTVFSPANANTALLSGVSMVYGTDTTTTFTLTAGTTALTAATQYIWECVNLA